MAVAITFGLVFATALSLTVHADTPLLHCELSKGLIYNDSRAFRIPAEPFLT